MEYDRFIIDVPAGEGHQEFCTIFAGSFIPGYIGSRPNEGDRRWSISISADLIQDKKLLGKLRLNDDRMVVISSRLKPIVVLRDPLFQLMDSVATASFLEHTFHDLHWIGLTPDMVVRYVSKRLLVRPFDYDNHAGKGTSLSLMGVEMNSLDIESSLRKLSNEWRQEQKDRFDV